MNHKERQLLQDEVGSAEPRLVVLSKAKIDTGLWWRRTPVWLCVVGDQLVMVSVARRRYIERVAIADCPSTHYNHASGELVIEPGGDLRVSRFPMSPGNAIRLLEIINPKALALTL